MTPIGKSLNRQQHHGAVWHQIEDHEDSPEHPITLGEQVEGNNVVWELRGWPLCHPTNNGEVMANALTKSRSVTRKTPLPRVEQGFSFLPAAGSPINHIDFTVLRRRLDESGARHSDCEDQHGTT